MNFRYWVGVIALAGFAASGAAQATNLVTNGDFTDGLAGWTYEGWGSGTYAANEAFGVAAETGCTGTHCVDPSLIGSGAAYLSQTIQAKAGTDYILQFTYNSTISGIPSSQYPNELKVLFGNTVVTDLVNTPSGTNTYDYVVAGTGSDTLTFLGRQDPDGLELGSISVSPVPLPTALPLFASAIAGVAGFGMRTRCRKAA